jgi:hypothetical protein
VRRSGSRAVSNAIDDQARDPGEGSHGHPPAGGVGLSESFGETRPLSESTKDPDNLSESVF